MIVAVGRGGRVGLSVGTLVGTEVVGLVVGSLVGVCVGVWVGVEVGVCVGVCVGAVGEGVGDGTVLSVAQYDRLKAQMEAQFAGADNAGRPMLLEGGLKWQAMSLSPALCATLLKPVHQGEHAAHGGPLGPLLDRFFGGGDLVRLIEAAGIGYERHGPRMTIVDNRRR